MERDHLVQEQLRLKVMLLVSTDEFLLFQQVPMVEMDGMKLVQTRAILSYIAAKYNLYGRNLKDRALYCISKYFP